MSLPMTSGAAPAVVFPRSFDEALLLLETHAGEAGIVAGATWVMRAAGRGEKLPPVLVSLEQVETAGAIVRRDNGWSIGPMVTHDTLARHCRSSDTLRGLGQAAGKSANPGVRQLATIGGNIAASGFAAADLVPALLALDASLSVAGANGTAAIPVDAFLRRRADLTEPCIITGIDIEDDQGLGAHARLTMRRAGEYPVAIVSVTAKLSDERRLDTVRIAVGSVETTARRWRELEENLAGKSLDLAEVEAAARAQLQAFVPRAGADAPSWYRLEVLPALVRTAFADIADQRKG